MLLQSPGGKAKDQLFHQSAFSYTVEINGKGENHTIQGIGAQIQNSVTKAVGYNYKVNNGKGTTAASKGTEFTFTDLSEGKDEKATIKTTEGTIHIIDEVPCTINGQPVKNERKDEPVTKSVLRTQSAGDGEFTSSDEPPRLCQSWCSSTIYPGWDQWCWYRTAGTLRMTSTAWAIFMDAGGLQMPWRHSAGLTIFMKKNTARMICLTGSEAVSCRSA